MRATNIQITRFYMNELKVKIKALRKKKRKKKGGGGGGGCIYFSSHKIKTLFVIYN